MAAARVVAVALVMVPATASYAGAHAAYKDSNPADRSVVSSAPAQVWAEFTEPPQDGPRLDIIDPCGERVDHGNASVRGYRVTVSMSGDRSGTYRAVFRVVSALDGHPTSGHFTFTSSGGAPCEGSEEPSNKPAARSGGSSGSSARGSSGEAEPSGSDPVPAASRGSDDNAPEKSGGRARTRSGQGKSGPRNAPDAVPVHAQAQGEDGAAAGDIPLDWLLVGFGISALIGAAAGQIYALILGPGKKRDRSS